MTLAEMRARVRTNIGDTTLNYSDVQVDAALNDALRHVANLADAADQSLFVATATKTGLTASTGFLEVTFNGSSPTLAIAAATPLRRLLTVWRTNPAAGGPVSLTQCDFEDRASHMNADGSDTPTVCVRGQSLLLITPKTGIDISVDYVQSLPEMIVASDTPGQASGSGTANLLPIDYQPLVPVYATVLLLSGENGAAAVWSNIYGELRDQLGATLRQRRGARTGER